MSSTEIKYPESRKYNVFHSFIQSLHLFLLFARKCNEFKHIKWNGNHIFLKLNHFEQVYVKSKFQANYFQQSHRSSFINYDILWFFLLLLQTIVRIFERIQPANRQRDNVSTKTFWISFELILIMLHKRRNTNLTSLSTQQENDEQFEIDISKFVPRNGVGTRFNVIQL